ncbi:uncharacterized protein LOC134243277 [Saccostrea cucullata]|uniref:uncharacterized protein LOC134243277 n=1 Tax=Saccostrea cuccullata TaxID=36930 RepID=UPI002ECFDAC4
MSDYSLIDNHRELTKLLAVQDVDIKDCEYSVRYVKREISDDVMENMIGKTLDLNNISLNKTNSFKYGDKLIGVLEALCEDQCYIRELGSDNIEKVNKEGDKSHEYNIKANAMCMNHDNGDVYFTDFSKKSISSLSPSGSVSIVISTDPLVPWGICQSVDDGLLVTLRDKASDYYKLDIHSRRLVRHITVTGDVIHEYEYREDGQTRLFTFPLKVIQNSKSDICVVNHTSYTTGELVILSPSGRRKSVYRGQNLTKDFKPTDAVCDSLCNILVTDFYISKKQIHLLSPDGEFQKFLLQDNDVNLPVRLSLYKSTLWVGYREGLVKVFQYTL